MTQPMSRHATQAGAGSSHLDGVAHGRRCESAVRGVDADKYDASLCCLGTDVPQIPCQRITHIDWQGQPLEPSALAPDDQLAGAPIDVVESERAYLAGAQAKTGQ